MVSPVFRLLWKTCSISSVQGRHHLDAAIASGQPFMPCYWHQQQLFCARYLINHASENPAFSLAWLVSPSNDGNMAAGLLEQFGVIPIRGSASRDGAQAMRDIYLAMHKDKLSPVITPDGPRGPIFECKTGVPLLAAMTGAQLLPIASGMSRGLELRSWDRFHLPAPGARIGISIGEPLTIDRQAIKNEALLAEAAHTLKARLDHVSSSASQSVA